MNRIDFILAAYLVILALLSSPLQARDAFVVDGSTTDTLQPVQVKAGDSDLINLVQQAIEATGPFQPLENRASTSVLDYGGASNAMRFDINTAGTQAILNIPVIKFQRTFTAANRDGLYNQIKNFLQNEGRDVYKRFLEAMNRQSTVAVSDGNPNSTTALVAKTAFEDAGFGGEDTITKALDIENINFSLLASVGQFSSRDFDGHSYTLPLGYSFKVTDRVQTKLRMPLSYWEVGGAGIYNGSFMVNVPVKVLLPSAGPAKDEAGRDWLSPLTWTVTPTLGLAGGGSQDYRAGSVMYVTGLGSMLNYDFGRFGLTLGNQLSAMKGLSNHVGDYDIGDKVDQRILKNGLKVTVPFDHRWVGEVYGIHTAFLKDAAVDNYFTLGAQGGMRLFGDASGEGGVALLGIYGDVGDHYRSFSMRLGTGFRF